jgi:hypothetical protein
VSIAPKLCVAEIYLRVYDLLLLAHEEKHVACLDIFDDALDAYKQAVESIYDCQAAAAAALSKAAEAADRCNRDLDP